MSLEISRPTTVDSKAWLTGSTRGTSQSGVVHGYSDLKPHRVEQNNVFHARIKLRSVSGRVECNTLYHEH